MLNIASDLGEKQGLNPDKWYEAQVVENDDRKHPDRMMLGRIQARIDVIFDGIGKGDLPWAIPVWDHPDGASSISGMFNVPKIGTKVLLKFQQGNPSFPMYRGYHVDMATQMEETKHNYPSRKVVRFMNKALLIVDTKDNVCYIRNPGNLKIYIDGNAAFEINGNVEELIHGNVRRVIKGKLDETVHGDVVRAYKSDYNFTVDGTMKKLVKMIFQDAVYGWRNIWTGAAKTETTIGIAKEFSTGTKTIQSFMGSVNIEAPTIHENSGNGLSLPTLPSLPAAPKKPVFYKWPGVPGSAKGTNTRNASTKSSAGAGAQEYDKDMLPLDRNLGVDNIPEIPVPIPPTAENS